MGADRTGTAGRVTTVVGTGLGFTVVDTDVDVDVVVVVDGSTTTFAIATTVGADVVGAPPARQAMVAAAIATMTTVEPRPTTRRRAEPSELMVICRRVPTAP